VERPFFDARQVVSRLLDPSCDRVTVSRATAHGFEDQQIEATAQDFDVGIGHRPIGF
jgi:hypothetical protein